MEKTQLSHEAIQHRAYHIWLREGRPHGRDLEHWNIARSELIAEGDESGVLGNGELSLEPTPAKKQAKRARKTTTSATARKPRAKRKTAN